MSDLEPLPGPPSARRGRDWIIAGAQSLAASAIGVLLLLVGFGFVLEQHANDPPAGQVALVSLDALLGLPVALAIGPMRMLRPGRLHTVLHLVAAAATGFSSWAAPAGLLALYRIGVARRPMIERLAVGLLGLTLLAQLALDSAAGSGTDRWDWLGTFALALAIGGVALILGKLRGTREELLRSLHHQAQAADQARSAAEAQREAAEQSRDSAQRERAAAEGERDATAARVRAEERTAIARDMHDSLSHHLSAIAMHAGAMTYRTDLPAEELRRAASTVRDSAQQAGTELREVLVALRTSEDDVPLADVPTLADAVESARARGQDVTLTWQGLDPQGLATRGRSTVVALARMLTEVVTNAAKHAPGLPLDVTLARQDERVVLSAVNPLPAEDAPREVPSTGHGLIGVQERARLLGGDARYRPQESPGRTDGPGQTDETGRTAGPGRSDETGRTEGPGRTDRTERTEGPGRTEGSFEVEAWVPW